MLRGLVLCLVGTFLILVIVNFARQAIRSDDVVGQAIERVVGQPDAAIQLPGGDEIESEANASQQDAKSNPGLNDEFQVARDYGTVTGPERNSPVAAAPRTADDRTAQLVRLYSDDPNRFSHTIESYLSKQKVESQWATPAESQISQWISEYSSAESMNFHVQCISDVCYIDFFGPHKQYSAVFLPPENRWHTDRPSGFLTPQFGVKAQSDFYRVYVFRDTFDPDNL